MLSITQKKRSPYADSDPAVQRLIDNMGGIHNIHLARLWSARRCLVVEGDDLAFLRHFHAKLFPNSDSPLDAIPNLSIGGWSGWHYAIGSSMLIESAVGRQIVTYCIFDSDYHTAAEIEDRYKQAAEKRVQLHIWKRKEIENYLLSPTVIQRVIRAKTHASKVPPSVVQVESAIFRSAEALKDITCLQIANSLQSQDRKLTAMTATQRARKEVEGLWSDPASRLSVVSGKDMLSALSEWSQGAYGVSFGAPSLARQFRAEEIPPEIVAALSAIEACEGFAPLVAAVGDV